MRALNIFRRLALVMVVSLTSSAWAQDSQDALASSDLGVIDMRGIIQQSNALATIRAALDEQNRAFQEDVSAEELRLRKAERELNSLKDVLAADEFRKRLDAFEGEVVAIQRSIQSQKNSFDKSIQQAQTQLEQELLKIVSEIAQERQLSMVFQRQNVVIYNNALDITNEALDRLNERTKNITVTRLPDTAQ
ncbi:MAG: OmpH family outer membrane protein [Alphaproteobacteria bacterium]|nr:OmpH family outer membrane protein [Alphaproteobacteria bacterium]